MLKGCLAMKVNEKNILEECLKDLGWRKVKKGGWSAPQIISQKLETFCVPA